MAIWKQTSLFTYNEDQTLENIIPNLQLFGEPAPYALVRHALDNFSQAGDLVLDPCCGIGTTGMVALEMERKVIMSDINQLAIRTGRSLFDLYNYNRVMILWGQIEKQIEKRALLQDAKWERFIKSELPDEPAFKRISGRYKQVSKIFKPDDLTILKGIYLGIQKVEDKKIQELFTVVFYLTVLEASLLKVSRNGQTFYIPKNVATQYPKEIFSGKLEMYLVYWNLIREQLARNCDWTPKLYLTSAYQLDYLGEGAVDYILCHLPKISGFSERNKSYLAELLMGELTEPEQEILINLDFQGRYQLLKDLACLLMEMERVLKEKGYLTFIFSGHNVLLTLLVRVAQSQGWDLIQENVEMCQNGWKKEYPMMSLTLQKKKQSTVLGALNKMKVETLYDTEEAILRKIDQFLAEHGSGTIEDIQRYLIENFLHDCLIEKPLEDLLRENFLSSGKYWLKPSLKHQEDFYQQRVQVLETEFVEFVREMIYYFLREEEGPLTFESLAERFVRIKPRMIFHTPYYRLWMEQCEKEEMKLHQLMETYFKKQKQESFETYDKILRRLVRNDNLFFEVVQGESLGLAEWSKDKVFKIYIELYERAKREQDSDGVQRFGNRALELLNDVTYLEEPKQKKIQEYILRSERL